MWKYPWKYAEGIAICIGLIVTGTLLQLTLGPIVLEYLKYPINLIFGGIFILSLLLLFVVGRKNKYLLWFAGFEATITSIAALLVFVIIMGFTRQYAVISHENIPQTGSVWWQLGFHQMTRSWIFGLLYMYLLFVLGLTTLKRISNFKLSIKDFVFVLNHIGLFIALFAGFLGNADMQRLRMQTQLSQPEWRATNNNHELVELPFAIELQSFTIDQYPPKLLIISNETGKAYPLKQPENVLVEGVPTQGKLLDWDIEVTEFLPMAASVITKDTVKYVNFETHGATSAVFVTARKGNNIKKQGWISAGNHMFPHRALTLDSLYSIVMPEREPKRYASDVIVYTESGKEIKTIIEVNKPLKVEGWKVYQLSYDESMGRWSNISIFELVKDPWLPYVYIGIIMMLIGAVGMFMVANQKKQ